jgi:hypothetical protein
MPGDRENVLGHGLFRAASRGINLCCAGALATAGVVFQSWTVFGMSIAGYTGMIVWDLSRLGFWKRVLKELRSRPPALPDPEAFADGSARHFVHRLHQARCELSRVLEQPRYPIPSRVGPLLEAIPDLEKRSIALVLRLEELSRYLSDKNVRAMQTDVERLRRCADTGGTPELRLEYRKAQFARQEEVAALGEIAAARELLLAKLETLAGTLEMFPCEVMRARVVDAGLRDQSDDPAFDPRLIAAEAESFDRVLTGSEIAEASSASGKGN